jgi:hypothetical protein
MALDIAPIRVESAIQMRNQRGLLRNRVRSTIAASINNSAATGKAVITELSAP